MRKIKKNRKTIKSCLKKGRMNELFTKNHVKFEVSTISLKLFMGHYNEMQLVSAQLVN